MMLWRMTTWTWCESCCLMALTPPWPRILAVACSRWPTATAWSASSLVRSQLAFQSSRRHCLAKNLEMLRSLVEHFHRRQGEDVDCKEYKSVHFENTHNYWRFYFPTFSHRAHPDSIKCHFLATKKARTGGFEDFHWSQCFPYKWCQSEIMLIFNYPWIKIINFQVLRSSNCTARICIFYGLGWFCWVFLMKVTHMEISFKSRRFAPLVTKTPKSQDMT